ncbi:ras GTPase-activating-like protein [Scheffersomyces amazonensis]|uniref:ras GTPase-activating-like protein n=1 Tax=Scheffersomyces amazonensis TaxID=1078765 RepID=UPI00315CC646
MASPVRGNISARYIENLELQSTTPTRLPLTPTLKHNSNQDLDKLARELDITPSYSKSSSLKAKFESPSATVNSFKTNSSNNTRNGSPIGKLERITTTTQNNDDEQQPRWAAGNGYKDILNKLPGRTSSTKLTPLKQSMDTPSKSKPSPFLSSPSNSTSTDSPGYEYLCRIQGIKDWLQIILHEEIIQEPAELITYIRNGIHLAKLTNAILPNKKSVFMNDSRLQFKHTENINRFFQLLDYLNVPDLFRFELTDLYDAKNVPKVFFCLHAMGHILHKSDSDFPVIKNLVHKLTFSSEDIRTANRSLVGSGLPNFEGASAGHDDDQNSYMNKLITKSPVKANKEIVHATKKKISSSSDPFISEDKKSSREIKSTFQTKLEKKEVSYKLDDCFNPELAKYVTHIIKLQSLSRGANFRYRMFVNKIMIKSYSDELTHFQSIIRGNLSRLKSIHVHRDEIILYKYDIIELQSIARQRLLNQSKPNASSSCDQLVQLQSIIRRILLQRNKSKNWKTLQDDSESILKLQSMFRRKVHYQRAQIILKNKDTLESNMIEFQSICRAYIYKRRSTMDNVDIEKIIEFQSIIRGNKVTNKMDKIRATMTLHSRSIKELQAIGRGAILRTRLCNTVLVSLLEDQSFDLIYAKIRGNKVRKEFHRKKDTLEILSNKSIIPLQSRVRGVLSRFKNEIIIDDLYYEIQNIIEFQSIIRGRFARLDRQSTYRYYNDNKIKVIKAQSVIRQALIRKAYKSLISNRNPPLSAIRKFAYLLSENEIDFEEEMNLSEMRDTIVEKAKINEELENQIENLDIKLGLLDKNKITLEDFIKNKKRYKSPKVPPHSTTTTTTSTNRSFEKLNKSSRERIELYQTLFYFLQTKPVYLIRLYNSIAPGQLRKDVEDLICSIFPITNSSITHHSREEFYFIKLLIGFMENDIETHSQNISDITKIQSCSWIDFFLHFNTHTYQRQHLKSLIGKLVFKIIENDEIDFESDPSIIYEAIIDKEIRIYGSSDNPRNISAQAAIKKEAVSNQFVSNLVALRETVTELLVILQKSMDKIPLHVKVICHHAYKLSQLHYPDKNDQQHLAVAGVIFMKHYIASILQYPENFGLLNGFDDNDNDNDKLKPRANLKHLSRVMLQVFSMKPFSDNFLKPLNDFLQGTVDTSKQIISKLINVKDIESSYEFNDYDDIVNPERPRLTMTVSNTLQLEKLLNQNMESVAPSSDDQLYQVLSKLYEVVGSSDEFIKLTEIGTLTFMLNPTTLEESLADSKSKSLFTQAKRAILYIARVQEGDNLLEVLVSGISKVHESKFRDIVSIEKKESEQSKINDKKRPYYKTSLGDLTSISYHDLKRLALEIIIKLEMMGELTRKNSYQDLLNMIAIDIRTKDSQRILRKQQLEISMKTVTKLSKKETFLRKQLKEYNSHIESILGQLQSKPKDKKLFNIIPIFSKQYFYHRELRKNNRLPKFGSYKYSAKKLLDQKVLVDFGGLMNKAYSSSSKLDFMFSCHHVGKFTIEAANGSVNIPGATEVITLDDLLYLQYENEDKVQIFNKMVIFNTQNFIGLLFRKFYDVKE